MKVNDLTTHIGVGDDGELVEVHDPGSTGHQIDKMHAILSVDHDGEGIVGFNTPDGWIPMVAADRRVIDKMKDLAQQMSNVTRRKMVVVEFSTRTVIDTIEPDSTPNT
jgi:hypothetical protein